MEKLIKGFNSFDKKANESMFSGKEETEIAKNLTSFEDEEEVSFGENELTGDNQMQDSNDDQVDDEIQYAEGEEQGNDTDRGGFNPNVSMTPQDWSVIKFMTDGGMRLGMGYSNEIDQGVEVVKPNLDYTTCCTELDSLSNELGIQQHDNGIENYLGGMHKSMINKPSQSEQDSQSTSYTE